MRFTKEITEHFVELVQQKQAELFPDSKKKDARESQEQAWNEVHSSLSNAFPTSGITLKQCQTKWKDLKAASKKEVQVQKR